MRTWGAVAGIVVSGMVAAAPLPAAEITVMANQGVISAVRDLAPGFEKLTGHKVVVSYEPGNGMQQKIDAGVPVDIATASPAAIDALIKAGKVVAGSRTNFAQAGVGIAVKAGAPRPDVSTPEAFKRAMLDARSIAYARAGASGLIAARVMERLGIADALKPKTKLVDGVPVAELIARGEAEIGLQQINVIVPVAGADYIGPLPAELQETVPFAAGLLAVSREPEVARAFLAFIASPDAAALIRKSRMEPLAN